MKKLSLISILEDIDLKKAKIKQHPFLKDFQEAPTIGLYAWAQAYNRLVYEGRVSGPSLDIEQINQKNKEKFPANLRFSKNSFKTKIDPEAENISLFGNLGTEHDIIHIVTSELAKNFARLRSDGDSRFNKTGHFYAKPGTPKDKRGPGPAVFGEDPTTNLAQYAWPEFIGNHLNDLVRSEISQGLAVSPKRTTETIISKVKRAYTEDDPYMSQDIGGIPEHFKQKLIDIAKNIIFPMLQHYNRFLRIYKRSAMMQQGMEDVPRKPGKYFYQPLKSYEETDPDD